MTWYRSGSISVTSGSTSVTGVGTNWIDGAGVGEAMWGPDGRLYEIANITSATSLTLGSGYQGATVTGGTYQIVPTQSYIRDLAAQAATLVADYGSIMSAAGQGKFGDGTVTQPGLRFTADENTGIRRLTSDTMALVAGGADVVQVTSSGVTVPALAYTGTLTGGTGVVNLGSGQFVKDASGNVGVGTASPAAKLDVNGNARLSNGAAFTTPNTTIRQLEAVAGGANQFTVGAIGFKTGDFSDQGSVTISTAVGGVLTERVVVNKDGNLGIGTASPATNLHVKGTANGWFTLQRGNDASDVAWQSWANADGSNKWGLGMLNSSNNLSVFNYSRGDVAGVFDPAGNFGLSVTPSAWGGDYTGSMQFKYGAAISNNLPNDAHFGVNSYYDGSNWRYITTGYACTRYEQFNGGHYWHTAPSGTAGNPISFTQAMALYADGLLNLTGSFQTAVGGNAGVFGVNAFASDVVGIGSTNNVPLVFGTNSNERARIDSSGNLVMTGGGSIGFSNNTSARPGSSGQYIISADDGGLFHQAVNNYYLVTTAGGSTSDAALKTDVSQVSDALAKVRAIRGVNFRFIEQPLCTADQGVQLGVIAQEVEAQFPEIVLTSETGTKTVRYDRLVAPLIEAVKELAAQNEALMARVSALEAA